MGSELTVADFNFIILSLGALAEADIAWAESCKPPETAEDFALEAIFVICNSGMKNTVARGIYDRVRSALERDGVVGGAFGHPGKKAAIEHIWRERSLLHAQFMTAARQSPEAALTFCADLPWIGDITKYHLVKNFGAQVAKPDVHLQRLADREGTTAQALCERLAAETGYRTATVDTLLWRACANGIVNSRTGEIAGRASLAKEGKSDD